LARKKAEDVEEKEDKRDAEDIMMDLAGVPGDVQVEARALRRNMSGFETKVWKFLGKDENPWGFLRQYPVEGLFLDFYSQHFNVDLEADGPHHLNRRASDRRRDRTLMKKGVRTIRLTPADFVKSSKEELFIYVRNAIENTDHDG